MVPNGTGEGWSRRRSLKLASYFNISLIPVTQTIALNAARFWRERPQQVLLVGAAALAGMVAIGGSALGTPSFSGISANDKVAEAPPAPPPMEVRQIAPDQALQLNQQIPLDHGPNPAARAFALGKVDAATHARALECLASAVYYEAGQESADGQRAVAQVVLNRVRHPAFPATVCGVVYEGSTRATGCQFTFTCDGSLSRRPDAIGWQRARQVAEAALTGFVYKPVGTATHYHANYVVPYWAETLAKNAVVGAHIFYRWAGGWGRLPAFSQGYSRHEPNVDALKSAALLAEQRDVTSRAQSAATAEAIAEIPGAQALPLKPSMRGEKGVAVRFNLVARKASDDAKHEDYVEKVKASDNLRYALNGGIAEAEQAPLGKAATPAKATGAGMASPE